MNRHIIMIIAGLALGATHAYAQQQNTTITGASTGVTISASTFVNRSMVIFKLNGEVIIDWKAVEDCAVSERGDRMLWGMAKAMLAVRDGTWKAPETK